MCVCVFVFVCVCVCVYNVCVCMYAHTQVGSTELYPDSREETILVPQKQITRIMDTYPSQRPIPSLGGGDDAEIKKI